MVGQEREHWKGRIDFLLAAVGYCVGLGNVWRFPYLCFIHGGSAFLLPYIIMTLVAGLPLFFMELAVGQFTSQGAVTAWAMVPLLSGIGWSMVMISAMVCVYYNVIIMYSLLYIFLSLTNIGWPVPWASCQNSWNKKETCLETPLPNLQSFTTVSDKISHSLAMKNKSCVQTISDELGIDDSSVELEKRFGDDYFSFEGNFSRCNITYSLPAQQYWNYFILDLSDDEHIGSLGSLTGRNAVFLFIAWVIVFVCIIRGPKSIAKVVYFTATYPLGILLVLLIRGVNIEGYNQGIDYYAVPKWEKLLDPGAWGAAASQVLYTMGIAFGGLVTFSSYNRFTNNIFRDSIIIASINAGASIFAGFVTFALIGSIAYETNMPVRELVGSGPELVFVIYPQGLSSLPSPAIWAFLYFLMVFTLGLDSQFGMMETIIVGVTDRFPDTVGKHRIKFVLVCCILGFLLGLPLTTKGGMYVLNLMNFYSASYALMILALIELAMIGWIYGVKNFIKDLELMLGKKHPVFWMYWIAMWLVVTPIIIVLMFIMAMVSYEPAEYEKKVIPAWAEFIGWLMVLGPLLCVIGRAVKMLFYKKTPILQALKPSQFYRPQHEQDAEIHHTYIEAREIEIAQRTMNQEVPEKEPESHETTDDYLTPCYAENEMNVISVLRNDSFNRNDRPRTPESNEGRNNSGFRNDDVEASPTPCHP